MRWLKNLSKPKFREDTSVVARYSGRVEGEEPVGKAVMGDAVPGEAASVLAQVILRDGSSLAQLLQRERIRAMDEWIGGEGGDPIPRALIRLFADTVERGEQPAEQEGIIVFWHPDVPPQSTWDGPATLAQMLGIPIKLYYAKPGADGYLVVTFDA